MALSQSCVEARCDLVEPGLTVDRQVGALGKVLAQQPVGVLAAVALPWAMCSLLDTAGYVAEPPAPCRLRRWRLHGDTCD